VMSYFDDIDLVSIDFALKLLVPVFLD
jgi:hypothetical protein